MMKHISSKKNVLVTGGSGFLGWHLASQLSKVHKVAFTYSTHRVEISHCQSLKMNLLHESTIKQAFKTFEPDVVVHTAALAKGGECEESKTKATQINVTGTMRLLDALPNKEALIIYISTDLVFDGQNAPYHEADTPKPISQYGRTKRMAEQTVQRMARNHHVILRPALIYGPPTASGKGSFVQWMDNTLQNGETLNLFSDEFRTPVYVMDIVHAVSSLIDKVGQHRIYHIGGPEKISREDFGRRLAKLRGYDEKNINSVKLADFDTGYPRAADVALNSERIQTAHALQLTPIEEALRETFEM